LLSDIQSGNGSADQHPLGLLRRGTRQAAREKLSGLIEDAVARGAGIRTGSHPIDGHGTFFQPTVLTGVATGSGMFGEEIFGPVAGVTVFDDVDEAVQLANATEYGLVAYLYSANIERALRTAERLDFSMVGINRALVSTAAAPFGGIKQSGLGREGGREGISDYQDLQYVAVDA